MELLLCRPPYININLLLDFISETNSYSKIYNLIQNYAMLRYLSPLMLFFRLIYEKTCYGCLLYIHYHFILVFSFKNKIISTNLTLLVYFEMWLMWYFKHYFFDINEYCWQLRYLNETDSYKSYCYFWKFISYKR